MKFVETKSLKKNEIKYQKRQIRPIYKIRQSNISHSYQNTMVKDTQRSQQKKGFLGKQVNRNDNSFLWKQANRNLGQNQKILAEQHIPITLNNFNFENDDDDQYNLYAIKQNDLCVENSFEASFESSADNPSRIDNQYSIDNQYIITEGHTQSALDNDNIDEYNMPDFIFYEIHDL